MSIFSHDDDNLQWHEDKIYDLSHQLLLIKEQPPPQGLTTQAKVVRVIDADTIEVEITRRFPVRLQHPNDDQLIFDSPSTLTKLGKRAKALVEILIGEYVTLFIPSNQTLNLMDINSFNRIIGQIWIRVNNKQKRLTQILMDKKMGRLVTKAERTTKPWPKE